MTVPRPLFLGSAMWEVPCGNFTVHECVVVPQEPDAARRCTLQLHADARPRPRLPYVRVEGRRGGALLLKRRFVLVLQMLLQLLKLVFEICARRISM